MRRFFHGKNTLITGGVSFIAYETPKLFVKKFFHCRYIPNSLMTMSHIFRTR